MDKASFDGYWHRLRQVWPAYKNEEDRVKQDIYWKRLRPYKGEAVESAIARHLDTGHRFPTIAQIIELLPQNARLGTDIGGMDEMNEHIRVKAVDMHHKGWTHYRLEWIATKFGTITGYRIHFWRYGEKGDRIDFGETTGTRPTPNVSDEMPFE